MDTDAVALIAELATRAAMTMEDVLESALSLGTAGPTDRRRRLLELERASATISKLVAAAVELDSDVSPMSTEPRI